MSSGRNLTDAKLPGEEAHFGKVHRGYDVVIDVNLGDAESTALGQPISLFISLRHRCRTATRLDILSDFSVMTPADPVRERFRIGFKAGSVYAENSNYAARVKGNAQLIARLARLRGHYIRVDKDGVSFLFAGSKSEWSNLLSENGGFIFLVNSVMNSLADLADALRSDR